MTDFVTSADGTLIAYETVGSGPVVILVAGASSFRAFDKTTTDMAHQLSEHGLTVVTYDRRGRGESTDTEPGGLDREIEDIAALIDAVGGTASLYGSSSGGALALWAAQNVGMVPKLALWEVPLSLEATGTDYLDGLRERLGREDRAAAVEFFMRDMPPEWLEGVRSSDAWPVMKAIAPTLAYDAEALARAQDGTPWSVHWSNVSMPTLVLVGERTLPLFPPAAAALVRALPRARQITIAAQDHGWRPEVMASVLGEFFTSS